MSSVDGNAPQPGMRAEGEAKQLAARLIGYVQARPDYSFDLMLMHVSEAISMFVRDLPAASPADPKPAPDAMRPLIARAVCCPQGCQYEGDSEDGSACYCDTPDYHGSGVEKRTNAVFAALSAPVSPPDGATEARETDAEQDIRMAEEESRANLRLIDFIADKIGLPQDEELSQENFAAWLHSPPSDDVRSALADRFRRHAEAWKDHPSTVEVTLSGKEIVEIVAALRSAPVSAPALTKEAFYNFLDRKTSLSENTNRRLCELAEQAGFFPTGRAALASPQKKD